jgi:2,3,4,5-tetrahydropyridine-2,6-dicarboxylate N-succinyltransferase
MSGSSATKEIMNADRAQALIEAVWPSVGAGQFAPDEPLRDAVRFALRGLDNGKLRIAVRDAGGAWHVHAWLKQAVLLSFRLSENQLTGGGQGRARYWDKVELKTADWGIKDFKEAGFRCVPHATVRKGAFIGKDVVLMPCYVNIGAYVGARSMIDTWSTVGSCAQIGENCHISGGVGIGGVLEPVQANPVIIEDNVFIGARSEVAEGVIVRENAVIAMGVFLGQSTKIVDRASGTVHMGEVPAGSVVVPGSLPDPKGGPSLACAVIVKTVDAKTRAKTGINELLRA